MATEEAPKKKQRSPLLFVIKLLIVIVVLGAGYKFGIGPVLSMQKGQPSTLYVINATPTSYQTSLGWRKLTRVLHPDSYVHFELYVGMTETQTLTLTPTDGGAPRTIKIELSPGCKLMLNLDSAAPFQAYTPQVIEASRAPIEQVAKAMQARKTPDLTAFAGQLETLGKSAVDHPVTSPLIDLTAYDPYVVEIDEFSTLPMTYTTPILTTETMDFNLVNGVLSWNAGKPDKLRFIGKLEAPINAQLKADILVKFPKGTAYQVDRRDQAVTFRISTMTQSTVTWEGQAWPGMWSYTCISKPGAPAEWAWSFGGSATIKGDEWTFSLTLPHTGKAVATKEKMDPML